MMKANQNRHEPLFHLTKREDIKPLYAWLIRVGMFIASLLVFFTITSLIADRSIFKIITIFFKSVFGSERNFYNVLREMCILLIITLGVTPCFKMKYWNIGGEGQVLMGVLGAAVIISQFADKLPNAAVIFLSLVVAIIFSVIWSIIPAIFKAFWNTNETLLTLMMNYIAACLIGFFIKKIAPNGTGIVLFDSGVLESVGPKSFLLGKFIIVYIVVLIVTILVALYLKYSKQGYEINVVGESMATAKYVGINPKKVIIRTLVISGVICGIAGFLILSAINHSINPTIVQGKGFTGVLISWIGHFNPSTIILSSFLVSFINKGATDVANAFKLGSSYASVLIAVFFLFIISTEFFINYKLQMRKKVKKENVILENKIEEALEEENAKVEEDVLEETNDDDEEGF